MKIQVMSDIHMEFGWNCGDDFIDTLDPEGVDVLVLAGDIVTTHNMLHIIGAICRRYKDSDVIYVHGNHEFYGSDRETVIKLTKQCEKENTNLHWLDNSLVTIKGQRFLGAPMWFEFLPDNDLLKHNMNDFRTIRGFEGWVYNENSKTKKFISKFMQPSDIVVTHHLPTERSVSPLYKGDGLNRFFLCNMYDEILEKAPALWIHGHTHESCDYKILCHHNLGESRVICNPRGYWGYAINPSFNADLIVEV